MHHSTPLALAVLVLGYALISQRVSRSYLAPALIFLILGIVLGPFGFHLLDAGPRTEGYTLLAQLALTLILFVQAAKIRPDRIGEQRTLTLRLLIIGFPLTLLLGAVTAVAVLPVLPWWEAVCLAAIVAPTEVALIEALLEDRRIPESLRQAMSVETGLYDGLALAALLIAMAFASQRTDPSAGHWAWFIFSTEIVSLLIGVLVGGVGGLLVRWSRERSWISDTWAQLATMALAFICFQLGEWTHASGFVAAFTGGLAFAYFSRRNATEELPTQVPDAAAQLLELTVFAMFGAFAVVDGWHRADWRVVLFAVLALLAVRIVAVLVALIGTGVPTRQRLFVGWFGPRGIGTVVLGLLVIDRGEIENADLIAIVVVVTVTLSLILHSLTARPGIRWLSAGAGKPA